MSRNGGGPASRRIASGLSVTETKLEDAGDRMNRKTLMCGVSAALLLAAWCLVGSLSAAQGPLLGDKHKTAGIGCSGCHTENPPREIAPTAACLGCHGDFAAVAARTGKLDPNPHGSHLGQVNCEKCHHGHKVSENFCATCHAIDLTVP
jgi:hypothetical protein